MVFRSRRTMAFIMLAEVRQKKKGVAVIFVGEDLDVLVELSDRIMVLCGGEVSGIVDARTTDKNEVGMMMTRMGGSEEHE